MSVCGAAGSCDSRDALTADGLAAAAALSDSDWSSMGTFCNITHRDHTVLHSLHTALSCLTFTHTDHSVVHSFYTVLSSLMFTHTDHSVVRSFHTVLSRLTFTHTDHTVLC